MVRDMMGTTTTTSSSSGGCGGGGDMSMNMNEKPAWLERLMAETFFGGCGVHQDRRKNEKNVFCLHCCLSICPHCLSSHRSHPLLQVLYYPIPWFHLFSFSFNFPLHHSFLFNFTFFLSWSKKGLIFDASTLSFFLPFILSPSIFKRVSGKFIHVMWWFFFFFCKLSLFCFNS